MNLIQKVRYGEIRGVELLADHPEVRLVLFSLQKGQEVRGKGEPRVHLLCLESQGTLWVGNEPSPPPPAPSWLRNLGKPAAPRLGKEPF